MKVGLHLNFKLIFPFRDELMSLRLMHGKIEVVGNATGLIAYHCRVAEVLFTCRKGK